MVATSEIISLCPGCVGDAATQEVSSGEVAECIQCGVVFLLPLNSQLLNSAEQESPDTNAAVDLPNDDATEPGIAWKLTGIAGTVSLIVNGLILLLLALIFLHEDDALQPLQFKGQFSLAPTEEFEVVADFEAGGQTSAEDALTRAEKLLAPALFSNRNPAIPQIRLAAGTGGGSGMGSGNSSGNGAGIFATSKSARSFAYVVDASGSMQGNRMQRVLRELNRSINALDPHQQFFVVFFSNRPFPMTWPHIERRLISASDQNRERILKWAYTVEPDGGTKPQGALQQALKLQPDVVFFLTDGAIPDSTERVVRLHRKHPTIVNAICIGGSAETRTMKDIAVTGGGELVVVK